MSDSEDKKPEQLPEPVDTKFINLTVNTPDGSKLPFKVKRTIKLKKLMKEVCRQQCLEMSAVRFVYDGARIGLNSTPMEYEMEDKDSIDVFWEQLAG